jgi:hypothetical protein
MGERTSTPDATTPESVLLRLFRCMEQGEQERLIRASLEILGEGCSFDPRYQRFPPDAIQQELDNENLDDRLFAAWPASWPGQQLVELDAVGDPGAWLEHVLGNPVSEILFGLPLNEDGIAAELADDYLRAIREEGFPLPSDFGDKPTNGSWTPEEESQVRAEFVAFFRHWREQVLQALESQKPSGG